MEDETSLGEDVTCKTILNIASTSSKLGSGAGLDVARTGVHRGYTNSIRVSPVHLIHREVCGERKWWENDQTLS